MYNTNENKTQSVFILIIFQFEVVCMTGSIIIISCIFIKLKYTLNQPEIIINFNNIVHNKSMLYFDTLLNY